MYCIDSFCLKYTASYIYSFIPGYQTTKKDKYKYLYVFIEGTRQDYADRTKQTIFTTKYNYQAILEV